MKRYLFFLVLAAFTLCSCGKKEAPVDLIFATDMAPDYDDVGALALLHALADSGEVNILATVASNKHWTAVPCIEVINTYFGRPDIPVAAVKGEAADRTTWHKGLRWTEELPKRYPHRLNSTDEAEDALKLYRRILSSRPDKSVTIVTVGFFTNLENLLLSGPDEISPLSGKELVSKKVKKLVSMAGYFPKGREFNVYVDVKAAQFIFKEWPTEILFSGFEIGNKVFTGKRLVESGVENSPIVDTYTMCLAQDDPKGRDSWDQTATLVAVRGAAPYFEVERGVITVNDDGSNTWAPDENGRHSRLIFKMTPQQITDIVENLMMYRPKGK